MIKQDSNKIVKNIGRRIAETRESRGLTQAALAYKTGMSLRWLQQIESGWDFPIKSLIRIANALNCDYTDFFKKASTQPRGRGRPKKRK